MSLRTTLRTARTALPRRAFSTTPQRQDDNSAAGPSQAVRASTSGFGQLSSMFNQTALESPGAPSVPDATPRFAPLLSSTDTTTPHRGYFPAQLPPKVDPVVDLFTNLIMKHGEKGRAEARMTKTLDLLRDATNQPPIPLLHRAVFLSSPSVKTLNMRKAMKAVPTPRALTERQRTRQGIMWILKAAEKGRRAGVRRHERVAREILAILEGTSEVFKWLEAQHKVSTLARANIMAR